MDTIEWQRYPVGPLAMNAYLVYCKETRDALFVDPGDDVDFLWESAQKLTVNLQQIVLTHGHFDHILHLKKFQEISGLKAFAHPDDKQLYEEISGIAALMGLQSSGPADIKLSLNEGAHIQVGKTRFDIVHTPGHSLGSISLISENHAIVGDALFRESIGRTDLPGGSHPQLVHSIQQKLLVLDDDVRVLPGHGETTTIGHERRHNPFLN